VTIKHILYEGARSNNILRINDESYEKLVDILNLPLENGRGEEEEKKNFPLFMETVRVN